MRKIWRWATISVAAAAAAAALAVAAMPTGAHANSTTQLTHSRGHIVTASCTTARNYSGGHVTFTYCDDAISRYGCFVGNNGAISGPLYAANGCSTQLYLYLGHTLTGTPALCVNPGSSTNTLKRYYEEFVVTSHTGRC